MTNTKAPERIWLQQDPEEAGEVGGFPEPDFWEYVTWCASPIYGNDLEYIRADLVVSETPSDDHQSSLLSTDEQQCFEVKEGYCVGAFKKVSLESGIRYGEHANLSEALTIRSVEDVRREDFEEAARHVEADLPNWRDDIRWAVADTADEIRRLAGQRPEKKTPRG